MNNKYPKGCVLAVLEDQIPPDGYEYWFLLGTRQFHMEVNTITPHASKFHPLFLGDNLLQKTEGTISVYYYKRI